MGNQDPYEYVKISGKFLESHSESTSPAQKRSASISLDWTKLEIKNKWRTPWLAEKVVTRPNQRITADSLWIEDCESGMLDWTIKVKSCKF